MIIYLLYSVSTNAVKQKNDKLVLVRTTLSQYLEKYQKKTHQSGFTAGYANPATRYFVPDLF